MSIVLSELSDDDTLEYVRKLIFFNSNILHHAKSVSLMALFKLEHDLPLTKNELFVLKEHLKFISTQIK